MGEIFQILPILIMLIYFAGIGFAIWFAISLILAQKERNAILVEISNKLDSIQFSKKDE